MPRGNVAAADDVEKSVAVPAADSTVALTDEEKHILERLKGSFFRG